jgi:hypothetical protein
MNTRFCIVLIFKLSTKEIKAKRKIYKIYDFRFMILDLIGLQTV